MPEDFNSSLDPSLAPAREVLIANPGDWLEYVYGSLFMPQATFTKLRSQPAIIPGAIVVIVANSFEAFQTGQKIWGIAAAIVLGLSGWAILTLLLQRLAAIFQPQVKLSTLLTLTAFASSPWIFIAPAQNFHRPWNILFVIAVMIWFAVWQVWAAAIALEINPWRLFILVQ
jgi:hypothetical protein